MQSAHALSHLDFDIPSRDLLLVREWNRVKGSLESLLKVYHSTARAADHRLDDLFEIFVQKVEYDSPLAAED